MNIKAFAESSADSWVEKGIKSDNVQFKIKCFEKAVEKQPDHRTAWLELGKARNQAGLALDAELALQRALRLSPDNLDNDEKIELIRELATCYFQQKKYESAKSSFQYLLSLEKERHEQAKINTSIGECYLGLAEYTDALNAFNTAIELEPMNVALVNESILKTKKMIRVDSLYSLGKKKLEDGEFGRAVDVLVQLKELKTTYKDADTLLADAQMKHYAVQLLADFPKPSLSQSPKIDTIVVKSTPPQLEVASTSIIQSQTSIPKIKNLAADSLFKEVIASIDSDDLDLADEQLMNLKKIDPQYSKLSQLTNELGYARQTRNELEQVAQFYSSGIVKMRRQNWLGSIIDFEKANLLYPNYKDIDSLLAYANYHLEKPRDTVVTVAESSYASIQQGFNGWYSVGLVLSVLFLPLMITVLLFPEVRARIYLLQGNYYRACQLYESILKRQPEKSKVYITLANLYLLKNRKDDKALQVYQNALQVEMDMTTRNKIAALVEAPETDEQSSVSSSLKKVVHELKADINELG